MAGGECESGLDSVRPRALTENGRAGLAFTPDTGLAARCMRIGSAGFSSANLARLSAAPDMLSVRLMPNMPEMEYLPDAPCREADADTTELLGIGCTCSVVVPCVVRVGDCNAGKCTPRGEAGEVRIGLLGLMLDLAGRESRPADGCRTGVPVADVGSERVEWSYVARAVCEYDRVGVTETWRSELTDTDGERKSERGGGGESISSRIGGEGGRVHSRIPLRASSNLMIISQCIHTDAS